MKKPTAIELAKYAREIGFFGFDPNEFLDHYDANGWMVGRTKMKDWQATVRTWKRRAPEFRQRGQKQPFMPISKRNEKINQLNRRKAELMRLPRTPERERELAYIQAQLHKL